jgi:hypothetical protein
MVARLEWWRWMATGMTALSFGVVRSRVGTKVKNRVEQRMRGA